MGEHFRCDRHGIAEPVWVGEQPWCGADNCGQLLSRVEVSDTIVELVTGAVANEEPKRQRKPRREPGAWAKVHCRDTLERLGGRAKRGELVGAMLERLPAGRRLTAQYASQVVVRAAKAGCIERVRHGVYQVAGTKHTAHGERLAEILGRHERLVAEYDAADKCLPHLADDLRTLVLHDVPFMLAELTK